MTELKSSKDKKILYFWQNLMTKNNEALHEKHLFLEMTFSFAWEK